MIHRTSPFVFFGSPSPFSPRRASSSSCVPTCLPFRRLASTRALTISPRAIHDRFACRLVLSRHVFRSLPSISRVPSIRSPRSGIRPLLKLSSAGRWAPEDFISSASRAGEARARTCVHVRVTARGNDAFYFKLATSYTWLSFSTYDVCPLEPLRWISRVTFFSSSFRKLQIYLDKILNQLYARGKLSELNYY